MNRTYYLGEVLKGGTRALGTAGVDNARYDAEELLGHVVGIPARELLVHRDRALDEETVKRYFSLIERRCQHYPLQYLLQEWDFYNLSFTVKEGVLIPRPETELLVDIALQFLKKFHTDGPPAKVLDLCSGSGCVGITVERNFPNCEVTAVEKSDQACAIIRGNMERNRTERFTLLQGDLFDGPEGFDIGEADLILANPPYLTKEEMDSLQAEVGFEPSLALYGGEDGLIFYRAIAKQWSQVLKKDGLIAVEIGEQQGESVADIFTDFSDNIKVFKDYSGLPRVVVSGPSFFLTI
ncbi:MAG: peptide chain release factor N(5)-glutamine methyltransferase [Clostridia bacterium]|nr:peptide chain release factor N(5)-glutamine methyltransferase [Clostridia bacterium]